MRSARPTPSLAAVFGLCAGLAAAGPAAAQQQQHQGTGHAGGAAAAADPAMAGMHEAHERMDRRMRQAIQGGGAERDFAAMMVPHHEGAVKMTRAALPAIRDPELRRMAEKTIQENQKDAEELRTWQQRHR